MTVAGWSVLVSWAIATLLGSGLRSPAFIAEGPAAVLLVYLADDVIDRAALRPAVAAVVAGAGQVVLGGLAAVTLWLLGWTAAPG